MPGRHGSLAAALPSLNLSEEGQVYALAPSGEITFLPDGGVTDAIRRAARTGELICPIPGCVAPRYEAVGGTQRRHHFRHETKPPGGHGPETLFHEFSKHALVQWVRAQDPTANVRTEAVLSGGARRADVLAELTDGRKIAFEVQWSPLEITGPLSWQDRHDWYAANGYVDVWLFAPSADHLQRATGSDAPATAVLTPLQQAMVAANVPVWWFNPTTREIASPVVNGHEPSDDYFGHPWWRPQNLPKVGPRRPSVGDTTVAVYTDPFDECTLASTGIDSPVDRWLAEERERIAKWAAKIAPEAEAALAERAADEAVRRAEEAERLRLEAEARARRLAAAAEEAARRAAEGAQPDTEPATPIRRVTPWEPVSAAWDASDPDYRWLQQRHPGGIPDMLTCPLPFDEHVVLPPIKWRTIIYRHYTDVWPTDETACCGPKAARPKDVPCPGIAVEALFRRHVRATAGFTARLAESFHDLLITSGHLDPA